MRTFQLATVAVLVAAASPALAEDMFGTYEVKYEEVANNCPQGYYSLSRGELNVRADKKQIVVDIARMPLMRGNQTKSGVVRAASKKERTTIDKLDGKLTAAGRADGSVLELVLIAEYYQQDTPLCSQSWNVTGNKKADTKDAPASPKSVMSLPLLAPVAPTALTAPVAQ